ncbi:MAG: hypothetical protein D6B27_02025 [Gammaproteobacteria bacterium]|nr:MAG: hypothetical protein D6B27_02025 [Gammaproteobacteria bacterium]
MKYFIVLLFSVFAHTSIAGVKQKDCNHYYNYCDGYVTTYEIKDKNVANYSWVERKDDLKANYLTLNIRYKNGDLAVIEHVYRYKDCYIININYYVTGNRLEEINDTKMSKILAQLYKEHLPKSEYKIKFKPSLEGFLLKQFEKDEDENFPNYNNYYISDRGTDITVTTHKLDIMALSLVYSEMYSFGVLFPSTKHD